MAKFIKAWETSTERNEGLSVTAGLEIQGRELRVAALGITNAMLAGSIEDSKLNQITTANKVAGSAVELQSVSAGGIANNSGLGLVIDDDMFSFDSVSGLQLDYLADELQFVPGSGLQINAVPLAKLPSTLTLTDGTRPFTGTIGGVDAVAGSDLTTLDQVQGLLTGDTGEVLLNLGGKDTERGHVGYIESVSGSFRFARADDPSTAKVQYIAKAVISDGASGTFQNPSTEIDGIATLLAGIDRGADLYLSTTVGGEFQAAAPSVSGQSIAECGWKSKDDSMVFFPHEPLDL